jgi:hypothetical protein
MIPLAILATLGVMSLGPLLSLAATLSLSLHFSEDELSPVATQPFWTIASQV